LPGQTFGVPARSLEALRSRAAHAGPISDETLPCRIGFTFSTVTKTEQFPESEVFSVFNATAEA